MSFDTFMDIFTVPISPIVAMGSWVFLFISLYLIINMLEKKIENAKNHKFIIDNMEIIIMPYVYDAIISAYKMSEKSVDKIQERMRGPDKLKFASIIYDLFPENIMGIQRELVYKLISREKFAELVSFTIDQVNSFIDIKQEAFDDLFANWVSERPSPNKEDAGNGKYITTS